MFMCLRFFKQSILNFIEKISTFERDKEIISLQLKTQKSGDQKQANNYYYCFQNLLLTGDERSLLNKTISKLVINLSFNS